MGGNRDYHMQLDALVARPLPPRANAISDNFNGVSPLQPNIQPYGWDTETADPGRITLVADPLDAGNTVLQVEVQAADFAAGGERCEVRYRCLDPRNSRREYSLDIMIPTGYLDGADTLFQHVMQWSAVPSNGNWDGFPPFSPTISLDYAYSDTATLATAITDLWDTDFPGWTSMKVGNFISYFFVTVGVTTPKVVPYAVPFSKNVWQNVKFDITWGYDSPGQVDFYYGSPLVLRSSTVLRNMHKNYPHQFKFGLYRDPAFATTNNVLFDNIVIGSPL